MSAAAIVQEVYLRIRNADDADSEGTSDDTLHAAIEEQGARLALEPDAEEVLTEAARNHFDFRIQLWALKKLEEMGCGVPAASALLERPNRRVTGAAAVISAESDPASIDGEVVRELLAVALTPVNVWWWWSRGELQERAEKTLARSYTVAVRRQSFELAATEIGREYESDSNRVAILGRIVANQFAGLQTYALDLKAELESELQASNRGRRSLGIEIVGKILSMKAGMWDANQLAEILLAALTPPKESYRWNGTHLNRRIVCMFDEVREMVATSSSSHRAPFNQTTTARIKATLQNFVASNGGSAASWVLARLDGQVDDRRWGGDL
jgi:hypothetical protein